MTNIRSIVYRIGSTLVYAFFLFKASNGYGQEMIIEKGDSWLYFDEGIPDSSWIKPSISHENWRTGQTPLGYGDDRIATQIGFGKSSQEKDISKFFKKTFELEDPYRFLLYQLRVQRDDGIVVYLNEREVMRDNMPQGTIGPNTRATNLIYNSETEELYHTIVLTPEDFISGLNTLSASVHQARRSSSDCLFNLELIGFSNIEMLPTLIKERSIKNLTLESQLKELNANLEIENRELQLQFEKQTNASLRFRFYTLCLLLGILAVIFLLVVRKKDKQLKSLRLELEALTKSNDEKSRELMHTSLNSIYHSQLLKELKTDLESLTGFDKGSIRKLINQIDYNLDNEDGWLDLLKHFNVVHNGFLEKLNRLHPGLSDTEQRHCVFIKLHMQTKEIAQTLSIDPRSVQTSRYRIKKRMGLDENIDLREYILQL